jgi:hypothetical protein
MESDFPLLRSILLNLHIPAVYRQVLCDKDNGVGMVHALTILGMLSPSPKKNALQQMGHRSGDRRWKNQTVVRQPHVSAICGEQKSLFTGRSQADWQRRQWDIPTLVVLCKLPVRRLVTDCIESGAFDIIRMFNFVGINTLAGVSNVDLVRALLATVPIPVLCSEICSLHDRMANPPFLNNTSSVGLLHYFSAMIASRYAFFIAGMPEMRSKTRDADNEHGPCDPCLESLTKRVQEEHLIHAGLVHAMREHGIFTTARGSWSKFDLLVACASTNRALRSVLDEELGRCKRHTSSCTKLLKARGPPGAIASLPQSTVYLLERMRYLIEAHEIDITKLIKPFNVVSSREFPTVMCVLEHVEKQGMLMDFVQDIYTEDEQLGTKLALVNVHF